MGSNPFSVAFLFCRPEMFRSTFFVPVNMLYSKKSGVKIWQNVVCAVERWMRIDAVHYVDSTIQRMMNNINIC